MIPWQRATRGLVELLRAAFDTACSVSARVERLFSFAGLIHKRSETGFGASALVRVTLFRRGGCCFT